MMATPILATENLHKSYGELRAVAGVNVAVAAGELHALIGPNGAGKTTLVALLDGSVAADRGRICLMGQDITRLPQARRAGLGLGRSYQRSCLVNTFTALENAIVGAIARQGQTSFVAGFLGSAFGNPNLRARGLAQLEAVGLAGRANVPVADMAHGEKRRLELALAVARGDRLLLLDEPMAGSGDAGRAEMTRLIRGLRGRLAILMIEHDMDVVFALAHRISVLVGGQIIASGSPEAIAADKAVQRAYLGSEAG